MKVLGVEYELIHDSELEKQDLDGECRSYLKKIRIRPMEEMLDDAELDEEKKKRYNEVKRHELIHAFFDECGLDEYSRDEILVQWIASQFPKLFELFNEQNCLL